MNNTQSGFGYLVIVWLLELGISFSNFSWVKQTSHRAKEVTEKSTLNIKNTGTKSDIPGEQMFERFKKGKFSEKNTGLGLSIVQKICELSDYDISYHIEKEWHSITITFKKKA